MKFVHLMMAVALVALMVACGGAPQADAAVPESAQGAEPTPVFHDDFETGQAESWAEGEEAQAEGETSEEAPSE